jgi:cell fate (sporulation/competence/biofilm development) regulator YmcA (YheA/YmcA/DUF963 family)
MFGSNKMTKKDFNDGITNIRKLITKTEAYKTIKKCESNIREGRRLPRRSEEFEKWSDASGIPIDNIRDIAEFKKNHVRK